MGDHERSTRGSASGGGGPETVCTCVPADESDQAHGGTSATPACACVGVERVVRRSNRLSIRDALVVGAFVALLVVVVLALWR